MGWLKRLIWGEPIAPAPVKVPEKSKGFFSTDISARSDFSLDAARARTFQRTNAHFKPVTVTGEPIATMDGAGMDADDWNTPSLKQQFAFACGGIPEIQVDWYASQGFIGYQMCAVLAQHWLVDKACTMPAKDATRNGYELTVNDGTQVDPEVLSYIRKCDKRFKIKAQCRELIRQSRIFGIRIAFAKIRSSDPDFYTNPFNPDGITPGSYEGIVQVDPYWMTPELDVDAAARPESLHFYEPTYWRINGKRYHRSHLIVIKTCEVPDVLKPTYFFGGIPLPQRIYERVYAAERTANEAPQLAMSKRTTVLSGVDVMAAAGDEGNFQKKMQNWAYLRDNYGIKVCGGTESVEQYDTSLTDFDETIMTQYQIVAAIAEVPSTKLLGTTPKGFQSTGEHEQDSYHEFLESLQEHDASPLVERHHTCVMRAFVVPKFGIAPFELTHEWNETNAETASEKADRELKQAEAALKYSMTGGIDGIDVRQRLIADPDSGWNGLATEIPEGPRPQTVVDPGAEKTAPNAPTPAEQQPPAKGNGLAGAAH